MAAMCNDSDSEGILSKYRPEGWNCDEYPWASTLEHQETAGIFIYAALVPSNESDDQGIWINRFYSDCKIPRGGGPDSRFGVVVAVDTAYEGPDCKSL